jgi:hypothetical protein
MTDNSTVVAAAPQPVIQYVPVQAPPQIQYVPAPAPPPEVRYVVAAQPQQVQQQPQAFMATIPTQTVVAAVPTPVPVPVPVPGPPVTQFVPVSATDTWLLGVLMHADKRGWKKGNLGWVLSLSSSTVKQNADNQLYKETHGDLETHTSTCWTGRV